MRKYNVPNEKEQDEKNLKKIEDEINILKNAQTDLSRRISEHTKHKEIILKKIFDKNPDKIDVADHAIVRHIERVHKIDIQALKKEIITPELKENALRLGGSGKYIFDGISYILKDYKVVTIINKK
ncbi:hypothetical protein ACMGDK_11245 [Chryseobacterium sp. DT-3]|uniref:hypothetical protein n=1 Tax=Chryseobacterium sp. DT-3 TaxID=3396164 RepID=UPI003F1AFD12